MSFEVRIEVFEGPFDLLLQLIMRQELDIHSVPVAQITASYLEHIERAGDLDLEAATEFLLIAATLLLIKARSLLPAGEEVEPEEETESARDYLVERLIEYNTFANARDWLQERYAEHGWYMPRLRELEEDYRQLYPDPFEGVELPRLADVLMGMLIEGARPRVDTYHIAPIGVSVEERMESVRSRLEKKDSTTFSKVIADCVSRLEVVATFLAILELYKKGEVLLSQEKTFGEIEISKRQEENSAA